MMMTLRKVKELRLFASRFVPESTPGDGEACNRRGNGHLVLLSTSLPIPFQSLR